MHSLQGEQGGMFDGRPSLAWQGDVAAALGCYEEAQRLSPGNADATAWLSAVYMETEVCCV